MNKTTIALALTLLFLPALAQAEKASSKQQHPDLSGSWTLNEAMSESGRDKMREKMANRRGGRDSGRGGGGFGGPPGGGRGGGRGGGSGGGGRGGGFGGSGGRRGGDRGGPMVAIDEGVDRMELVQTDDQLSITYSDDRLRILFTDGRKDKRTGAMGDIVTTAKWNQAGELVVKAKTQRGKVTEIYKLDDEGERLLVDITIDGPMGEITFHRTYDPTPDIDEGATGSG